MIFICRGIALDGIVCDGFGQTIQVYISLDSKIYFLEKKQKYFWIRQKYIETSVKNPPHVSKWSLNFKLNHEE